MSRSIGITATGPGHRDTAIGRIGMQRLDVRRHANTFADLSDDAGSRGAKAGATARQCAARGQSGIAARLPCARDAARAAGFMAALSAAQLALSSGAAGCFQSNFLIAFAALLLLPPAGAKYAPGRLCTHPKSKGVTGNAA